MIPISKSFVPRTFILVIISAIICALIVAFLPVAVQGLFQCASGWDGFGCAISAGVFSIGLSYIVAAIAGVIILRRSLKQSSLVVVFVGAAEAAILSQLVSSVLQQLTALPVFIYGISFVIGFGILYLLTLVKWPSRIHFVVALSVLLLVSYFAVRPLANIINHHVDTLNALHSTAALPFTVLVPSYMSSGFTFDGGSSSLYAPSDTFINNYNFVYSGKVSSDKATPGLYFYEYVAPDYYQPPSACTGFLPPTKDNSLTAPCSQIGSTPTGEPIYYADKTNSNDAFTSVEIGKTVVVIETDQYQPAISNDELVKILSSLKPTSAHELQQMNAAVKPN